MEIDILAQSFSVEMCLIYVGEDSHTSTLGLSGSPFLTLAIEERRHIGVGFHTSLLGTTPHTVANGTVLAAIVLETWCFTFRALSYWSDISCNMINTLLYMHLGKSV